MALVDDNLFPKVILSVQSADQSAPANGDWKLYSKAAGVYARSSNAVVGPFGAAGAGGSVATDAIWDAAGDLAQGTGANTAAKLSAGTAGQFLKSGGAATANSWASRELDYVAFTSPVNITATTEGTGNTIVTGSSVAYDGTTIVVVEFFAPYIQVPVGVNAFLTLTDGGTSIGKWALITSPDGAVTARVPLHLSYRFTPSNASHTYTVEGYTDSGTPVVGAGAGGAGNYMPGFIRITRAV